MVPTVGMQLAVDRKNRGAISCRPTEILLGKRPLFTGHLPVLEPGGGRQASLEFGPEHELDAPGRSRPRRAVVQDSRDLPKSRADGVRAR